MKKIILTLAAAAIAVYAMGQDVQQVAAQAAAALAEAPESKTPDPKPVSWTKSGLVALLLK